MTGGARKGAGRKPAPFEEKRVAVCIKLHPDTVRILREQAAARGISQARVVEEAIRCAQPPAA